MLSSISQQFKTLPLFQFLKDEVEKKRFPQVTGLPGASKALFIFALGGELNASAVVISAEEESVKLYEDLRYFSSDSPTIVSLDEEYGYLQLLSRLKRGERVLCVTTPETLLKKAISPEHYTEFHQYLIEGAEVSLAKIQRLLVGGGYERTTFVENPGEFSVRGAVVDVFVPRQKYPWRLELNGDLIESIREFEPLTQCSLKNLENVEITAFKTDSDTFPLWQYFPLGTVCIFNELAFAPDADISFERFLPVNVTLTRSPTTHSFEFQPMENFHGALDLLRQRLEFWQREGYSIFCFADNAGQQERFIELLQAHTARYHLEVRILSGGFFTPALAAAVITDEEIFGRYSRQKYLAPLKKARPLEVGTFVDLKENDYVVHEVHGIGIYEGLRHLAIHGREEDFLGVRYAEGDRLYVPVEQMHLVQKYISAGQHPLPHRLKIYRLGGSAWQKIKQQVKESTLELAQELLHLYSERQTVEGLRFVVDTHWQKEFESSFIYEETPDQLAAIAAVKRDLAQNKPMDRLICGDVGYGKTEVAMRAAFIAVDNNRQVAILVPTTLLAEQHLHTFRERFADYPVRVEMLSRFRSRKEQEKTVSDLKKGLVDIVIGTHRLLQKDIVFKHPGLLVIDEEQRFGVRHKERMKQLYTDVHVLALSATPIPRTMEMALSGLRDISVINNPPEGRQPVRTYVSLYNEDVVREAIQYELRRQGQVFFVHNRVQTIERCARRLEEFLPGVKIKIAHGQMPERTLEQIMLDFIAEKFEVVVSTTIIESGLDLPNVNTLIIDDATRFGLADLYQLRGRVGRSSKKAYCYFFFPKVYPAPARSGGVYAFDPVESRENGEKLPSSVFSAGEHSFLTGFTQAAADRLKAIQEFSHLGSGFKIAMRDLEMRGAGNLLGREQSGYVYKVGFDLYCKLLQENIEELRGQKREEVITPVINLRLKAYIPAGYIFAEEQRLEMYKRLSLAEERQELSALKEEVRDRYGPAPLEVENLFAVLNLRLLAQKLFIQEIREDEQEWQLIFHPSCRISGERFIRLAQQFGEDIAFAQGPPFSLRIKKIIRNGLKNILQNLGE